MARAKPKRTRRVIFTKILRHYRKETKLQSEVEIKVKPALLHAIRRNCVYDWQFDSNLSSSRWSFCAMIGWTLRMLSWAASAARWWGHAHYLLIDASWGVVWRGRKLVYKDWLKIRLIIIRWSADNNRRCDYTVYRRAVRPNNSASRLYRTYQSDCLCRKSQLLSRFGMWNLIIWLALAQVGLCYCRF